MAGRRRNLSGFPVTALFVPALHAAAGLLADLFDKEWGAARRTGLGNRTVPQRKLTGRIFAAGKERAAFAGAFLHQIAAAPRLRTFHTQRQRLRRLACGIGRACDEFPEASGLYDHRTSAFFTDLISSEFLLRDDF